MLPEPGRRGVLITRPAGDAAGTSVLVAQRGFSPIVAPVLDIQVMHPPVPPSVQAILVTSGNALAGLPLLRVPLLAVGDATASRARAHGFGDVHSAGRDAQALAELASRLLQPAAGSLLLACGEGQGAALAADLRGRGFRVARRVCYAARAVRRFPKEAAAALAEGRLHAAVFLSAETAMAFRRLLPARLQVELPNVYALAIGKPAADALEPLPWRQIRLAGTPTLDDVLTLL